jgi:hypothetical protein
MCGGGSGIDSRGISYTSDLLLVIFVIESFEHVFEFMILRKRQLDMLQPSTRLSIFIPSCYTWAKRHVGASMKRWMLTINILIGVWHFSVDRLLRGSGCEILMRRMFEKSGADTEFFNPKTA